VKEYKNLVKKIRKKYRKLDYQLISLSAFQEKPKNNLNILPKESGSLGLGLVWSGLVWFQISSHLGVLGSEVILCLNCLIH